MMRRVAQLIVVLVVLLALGSLAMAQQTPQPVVRMGNWIEVGNDVFMHIMATMDARYRTSQNADFESQTRDRTPSRNPTDTPTHDQDSDLFSAELRFGAEFRYQKNLHFYLLFENQQVFDGALIDDRANTSNPGGTDVFGRAASTENPGFRVERFWARYQFSGTPITLHVGPDLWAVSQSGILGNDNPRIAIEAKFGDLNMYASAVIERESQRLGLTNDNDQIYYVFGGTYDLKPHRFGLDVVWFRDRFSGADTQTVGFRSGSDLGWTGQKHDSVWVNASWSGKVGPLRGLLQGNVLTGTARGANARGTGATALPASVPLGKEYDILAGAVVAYAEVDLGVVKPFVGFIYGTGDGDPNDNKLGGFQTQTISDSTQITGTPFFNHLEASSAFALRDYSCPAYSSGVASRTQGVAGNPAAVGAQVLGNGGGTSQCSHSTSNVFNSRLGNTSHSGIVTTYSNPGTFDIPAGLKVNPLKGHELVGWYVYRAIVSSNLLNAAFAPELRGGSIGKTLYHGIGGQWQWNLNPHFDIRLSGEVAVPGDGYKDIARLSDCNPSVAGVQSCEGNDPALRAEARFRARF